MTLTIEPAALASPLQHAHRRLAEGAFIGGLWSRRLDIWTADAAVQQKIGARLGWLDAPAAMRPHVPRIGACAQSVRDAGFTDVVLLGMGGSSLAPEVLRRVAGVAPGFPRFRVLDSVDPDAVRDAMQQAATSLFILASKSGTTIEPNVMAAEAMRRVRAAGHADAGSRFIAITDDGTALHRRAVHERFRDAFINPSDIGGRYSALSLFGLLPAALMGIDVDALLDSGAAMADACRSSDPAANPGLALGAFMAAGAEAGRDKLTLHLSPRLEPFGLWVEQLVAESTGKHGKGIVPIAGEPADVPAGDDRIVVAVAFGADRRPGADNPLPDGTPAARITMPDAAGLGAEFFRWEVATAAAGWLLGINPFDEPNVQQAKDATRALLDTYAAQRRLPLPEPHGSVHDARITVSKVAQHPGGGLPRSVLGLVHRGDYIGLLAFLPPDDERLGAVLQQARAVAGTRARAATMLGYGPRYLHSTGQLHKGGANNGVFVLLTAEAGAADTAIPGEPFSFGTLEMAQAVGDFQSLERTGRRAVHVHLPSRDPDEVQNVLDALLAPAS